MSENLMNVSEGQFTVQEMLKRMESKQRKQLQGVAREICAVLTTKQVKFYYEPQLYRGIKIQTKYWTAKLDLVQFFKKIPGRGKKVR